MRPRETPASVSAPTAHSLNPALAFASARSSTSNSISTGPTANTSSGCELPTAAAAINSSRTAATASPRGTSTPTPSPERPPHQYGKPRTATRHTTAKTRNRTQGPVADGNANRALIRPQNRAGAATPHDLPQPLSLLAGQASHVYRLSPRGSQGRGTSRVRSRTRG